MAHIVFQKVNTTYKIIYKNKLYLLQVERDIEREKI